MITEVVQKLSTCNRGDVKRVENVKMDVIVNGVESTVEVQQNNNGKQPIIDSINFINCGTPDIKLPNKQPNIGKYCFFSLSQRFTTVVKT